MKWGLPVHFPEGPNAKGTGMPFRDYLAQPQSSRTKFAAREPTVCREPGLIIRLGQRDSFERPLPADVSLSMDTVTAEEGRPVNIHTYVHVIFSFCQTRIPCLHNPHAKSTGCCDFSPHHSDNITVVIIGHNSHCSKHDISN